MAKIAHPTGSAKGLEYLSPWDDGFDGYLDFMDIGIHFARRNKEIMAQEIMDFLKAEEKDGAIKTNHNYYDREERVIRKGSVSARKGEKFLCPINMRDGTFICLGKAIPTGIALRRMARGDCCHGATRSSFSTLSPSGQRWGISTRQLLTRPSTRHPMPTRASTSSVSISSRQQR